MELVFFSLSIALAAMLLVFKWISTVLDCSVQPDYNNSMSVAAYKKLYLPK